MYKYEDLNSSLCSCFMLEGLVAPLNPVLTNFLGTSAHNSFHEEGMWRQFLLHRLPQRPAVRSNSVLLLPAVGLAATKQQAWVNASPSTVARLWGPNWQCLLGSLLPGTWHPVRWSDAKWQDHWGRRWLLRHLLQWDGHWPACAQGSVCKPGTRGHWWSSPWHLLPACPPWTAHHRQGRCPQYAQRHSAPSARRSLTMTWTEFRNWLTNAQSSRLLGFHSFGGGTSSITSRWWKVCRSWQEVQTGVLHLPRPPGFHAAVESYNSSLTTHTTL